MSARGSERVRTVLTAHAKDLGGFTVRRVLPSMQLRMVGPFTFFDEMGPATFAPGEGMDVRPHPHIGLATVTYLFEGAIDHRDSVGPFQTIRPGDINWMTAGRGIVHSERTPPALRASGGKVHGLQLWIALPTAHEECEPSFEHHPAASLPERALEGGSLRLLAGSAFGLTTKVGTRSPLFYADVRLDAGASVALPAEHEERGAYVVEGAVTCEGARLEPGELAVFEPGGEPVLRAEGASARFVLLGGARLDGPRFIEWNFVSSRKERIEEAKRAWQARAFAVVPGDEAEFIPLPA